LIKTIFTKTEVRLIVAVGILLLVDSTAQADRAAADRCAASLPPASQTLYARAMSDVLAGKSLEDALTPPARWMVLSGALSIAEARTAAGAAADCLKLAR
jgi:hypothetical protein